MSTAWANFNAAVGRVLGYTQAQLETVSPMSLVHPEDHQRVTGEIRVGADGADVYTLSFRVRHADGHWLPVEAVASDRTNSPEIRGWVFAMRDVTERVQAEGELRRRRRVHGTARGPGRQCRR